MNRRRRDKYSIDANASHVLLTFSAIGALAQPLVDHHQHLFHPAVTGWALDTGTVTTNEFVAYLHAAGIRRALVAVDGVPIGNPNRPAAGSLRRKEELGRPGESAPSDGRAHLLLRVASV